MEKSLRVLGGDEAESSAPHSHSHSLDSATKSTAIETSEGSLKSRSKAKTTSAATESNSETPTSINGTSKLSAYLNLFGDFVHNMLVTFLAFSFPELTSFVIALMDLRTWDFCQRESKTLTMSFFFFVCS